MGDHSKLRRADPAAHSAGSVDFACSEATLDFRNPRVQSLRLQMLPVSRPLAIPIRGPRPPPSCSACEHSSDLSPTQVFAAAVAIIYNSLNVNSLVLSRQLVNAMFLGRISWSVVAS